MLCSSCIGGGRGCYAVPMCGGRGCYAVPVLEVDVVAMQFLPSTHMRYVATGYRARETLLLTLWRMVCGLRPCHAVQRYRAMQGFHKYYSGESVSHTCCLQMAASAHPWLTTPTRLWQRGCGNEAVATKLHHHGYHGWRAPMCPTLYPGPWAHGRPCLASKQALAGSCVLITNMLTC